jgi:ketosteroid isomerase-like protein
VVKHFAIAFDHLIDHEHTIHHLVCEGDVVFLDHTAVWTFRTGEKVSNQFATLHEMKNGKVSKWSDYWDVSGFVRQFLQRFLEEMAKHTQETFTD